MSSSLNQSQSQRVRAAWARGGAWKNLPLRRGVLFLGLAVLPFFLFRLLPGLLPYAGQGVLENLHFSLVIQDVRGEELQVLPLEGGLRRIFLPLSAMPKTLLHTVLRAEDRRFWFHPGVDPFALLRAAAQNLGAGETVSGASTLSMQLARLLSPRERTFWGKLREAWDALQLESRLGKQGVLELYLNLVPFGSNIEGFPAAARAFFGKSLKELSLREFCILAVIPRSPKTYNPYDEPENNLRAALVLKKVTFVDDSDFGQTPLVLDPGRSGLWPFRAPHYIRWLEGLSEFKNTGIDGRHPIRTGIEPEFQNYLENLVARTVEDARPKRISNAAALFVRPDTMTIAAWVGSADFLKEDDRGQIDGVTIKRQPGSTLKPFLYSLALESGFTASTVLPDIPSDFGGAEVYTPANFNDQFNGPVRLRQALASSLNVPAVYTLQRIGVLPFTDFLISAGFVSLEAQRGRLGLGLSLGNAELSLFELVQAYGLFVHHGEVRPILSVLPDESASGVSIDRAEASMKVKSKRLLDPRIADLVRDILTRHPDRTLSFGRGGNMRLSFEGALKTGTSNQFNNIWAIGFTPDLLGGIWMGNFLGETVVGTADSGYPASILAQSLEAFGAGNSFPPLEGLERHLICSISGMLSTEYCNHTLEEWFLPGTLPPFCDWHRPDGSLSYPQEYHPWLGKYRYQKNGPYQESPLRILRPRNDAVFFLDPTLPSQNQDLALETLGSGPAEVWLDGALIHQGSFPLKLWIPLERGHHSLSVRSPNFPDDEVVVLYEVR